MTRGLEGKLLAKKTDMCVTERSAYKSPRCPAAQLRRRKRSIEQWRSRQIAFAAPAAKSPYKEPSAQVGLPLSQGIVWGETRGDEDGQQRAVRISQARK